MTPARVAQRFFARLELMPCPDGVSQQDGIQRVEPMNSICWIIGYLAAQGQHQWSELVRVVLLDTSLPELVGNDKPASRPPLDKMWTVWEGKTNKADQFLETIASVMVTTHQEKDGAPGSESAGRIARRNIYRFRFHIGEAHSIRQVFGHRHLQQHVWDPSGVEH